MKSQNKGKMDMSDQESVDSMAISPDPDLSDEFMEPKGKPSTKKSTMNKKEPAKGRGKQKKLTVSICETLYAFDLCSYY